MNHTIRTYRETYTVQAIYEVFGDVEADDVATFATREEAESVANVGDDEIERRAGMPDTFEDPYPRARVVVVDVDGLRYSQRMSARLANAYAEAYRSEVFAAHAASDDAKRDAFADRVRAFAPGVADRAMTEGEIPERFSVMVNWIEVAR